MDIPAGRRALLIVNEHSRRGQDAAGTVEALLRAAGLQVTRETAPGPEALAALIRQHATDIDLVVLGGGDGTFNTAAPALVEAGLPLGLLPLGTGNDLARTLGIPLDPEAAVRIIVEGHTHKIDLGEVNGRPFFNVASLGLSARLTRNLTSDVKRRWGRLGYAIALFRALFRGRSFSAEIICNGETKHVRTLQIAVGNGRHYGAGMTVEADARIDDGILNLYSLEFDHPWRLLLIYPAFRKGRHGVWRQVRTLTCEAVEIRTHKPKSINTDGEITTQTPAKFRVLRQAVTVIVPKG